MLSPHLHAALAHERHQTFLAQAEAGRRARQARSHRRQAGTSGARRLPLRRRPAWLRGAGIARYVRDADDPQTAEIAVTIIDDWQGRGLGTELVAQLSERARAEGIRRFTAPVAAGNPATAGLPRNVRASLVRHEPAALEYEITLGAAGEYTPAGSPSSSDDPAGRLPESAAITIATETRPTTARSSPDRLSSYDTYSGWAQQGTAQAWSCPLGTE